VEIDKKKEITQLSGKREKWEIEESSKRRSIHYSRRAFRKRVWRDREKSKKKHLSQGFTFKCNGYVQARELYNPSF